MSAHRTLDEFADEHGTTDDAREDVELNPPNDGHLRREHEIHDYWAGTAEWNGKSHPAYSIVPPGQFAVVFTTDSVRNGWSDDPPEPGVYLGGKADVGSTWPPHPVAVDDSYLEFAAGAAIRAVADLADPDDRVVAISVKHLDVTFGVCGQDWAKQEDAFTAGDSPVIYPKEKPEEVHYGFYGVRRFGTPFEIYSKVKAPRLELDDIRVDIPGGWS